MNSSPPGVVTSPNSEVTNISTFGFWLWVADREYFVPFDDYPVFRQATIAQMLNFRQIGPAQFHWPDLDADIELDALEHPQAYPLKFKS
jgi:hypothetical protein